MDISGYEFFLLTGIINPETGLEIELSKEVIKFKTLLDMENYIKQLKVYNERQKKLFKSGHIPEPKYRKIITN